MKIKTSKPFIPEGWLVEEHIDHGKIDIAKIKIDLHLEPEQQGNYLTGNTLRERLKDKPVLNACVLDYLLEHQELIPNEWKGRFVFFWGTTYRSSDGSLYVRYLYYWNDRRWGWNDYWLDNYFYDNGPAVISASLELSTSNPSELGSLETLQAEVKELKTKVKELENWKESLFK